MLSDPHEYFPHLLWQTLTRNLPVRSINYTGLSFQLLNTNLFLDRRQKTECTPLRSREIPKTNILLAAQSLIYKIHTVAYFDPEGRWSAHGKEESSEEVGQENGQKEEVVAP